MQFLYKEFFFFTTTSLLQWEKNDHILWAVIHTIPIFSGGHLIFFLSVKRNDCKNPVDSSIMFSSLWTSLPVFKHARNKREYPVITMHGESTEKMEIWVSKACAHEKTLLCASNVSSRSLLIPYLKWFFQSLPWLRRWEELNQTQIFCLTEESVEAIEAAHCKQIWEQSSVMFQFDL